MRRASKSICVNVAEGFAKQGYSVAEFKRFIQMSVGSADEMRVWCRYSHDLGYIDAATWQRSRDEYLGGHATHDAAFLKDAHIQITRRTARMEAAIAWVGTESELHATKAGKPLTLLSTETMVLKNTSAGWRIVHIHWSSRPKR